MNLKNKIRSFFTLNPAHKGGFTLVELIVVIAILGILAGIGVPAYGGYVKKANIAADETLADSIADALVLHSYTNPDASGYVILSNDAAPIVLGVEDAMTAAFGSDLSGLTLKYDGWLVNADMLELAISGAPEAVTNSSYVQNSSVSDLLGNVQTVVGAAYEVLGSKARDEQHMLNLLKNNLGEEYMQKAVESGIIEVGETTTGYKLKENTFSNAEGGGVNLTQDLQNQLANMMVFGVAEEMSALSSDDVKMMMVSDLLPEEVRPDLSDYNPATVLAARYAFYKAYAVDNGAEDDLDDLNDALLAASEADGALAAVEAAFDNFVSQHATGMSAYVEDENGDPTAAFLNNVTAIPNIMTGIGAVEDKYTDKDTLADGNLYTSGGVANDLSTYINMAGLAASGTLATGAFTGISDGILISVGAGNVAIIASAE